MDIGELLSFKVSKCLKSSTLAALLFEFQPEQTPKRPTDDAEPSQKSSKKSKRGEKFPIPIEVQPTNQAAPPKKSLALLPVDKFDEILRYVDEQETTGEDVLDEGGLKKLVLLLEKRILKNQEMRIKFPDSPEKFMSSEIELNDILQQLSTLTTQPDNYPLFVRLGGVNSLLELLSHPNSDISIGIVDLLQELTDADILHESVEGAETLIEALRSQEITSLLVSNLERLNESATEEAAGVHQTLAIFENLLDIKPELCNEVATQGLMEWILKRIKVKTPYDANKLYCSEILSILIQDNNENRTLLGNLDGIDVLLQQLVSKISIF